MPPGMHYRRGHWVKNPSRKSKAASGWILAAMVAVGIWALNHGHIGSGTPRHPASPSSSSHPAARR